MRELMNLVENEQRRYFHGSRKKINIGDVLSANRPRLEPEEKSVEMILERYRPAHCLPRHQSIFMVDTPDSDLIERAGGYSNHIYEIRPQGKVERNDVHWWAMILNEGAIDVFYGNEDEKNDALNACRPFAESYWKGEIGRAHV